MNFLNNYFSILIFGFFVGAGTANAKNSNRAVTCFNLSECLAGNYKRGTDPRCGGFSSPTQKVPNCYGHKKGRRHLSNLELNINETGVFLSNFGQLVGPVDEDNGRTYLADGTYYQTTQLSLDAFAVEQINSQGKVLGNATLHKSDDESVSN